MEGEWFDPATPDVLLPGVLDLRDASRPILRLIGLSRDAIFSLKGKNFALLHGRVSDGDRVTLVKCYDAGAAWGSTGVGSLRLLPEAVLTSVHLPASDVRLEQVALAFTHLDAWVGRYGFVQPEKSLLEGYRYRKPKAISLCKTSKGSISIQFPIRGGGPVSRAPLTHRASLVFKFDEAIPFTEALSLARRVRQFFVFASGSSRVSVTGIDAIYEGDEQFVRQYGPLFEVIAGTVYYPKYDVPDLSAPEFLFRLSEVRRSRSVVLRRWVEDERLWPVIDLHTTAIDETLPLEERFQRIVTALESLHRRTRVGRERTKAAHRRRISAIVDRSPQRYRTWLREQLHFSNEISLARRLDELVRTCRPILQRAMGQEFDCNASLRRAKQVRDYLAHYSPESQKRAPSATELYNLTVFVTVLLEACLLRELGMGTRVIERIIGEHRMFRPERFLQGAEPEFL